jgi:hypothetical protein
MKCLDLAKDGVHALLLVLSVRNRFTDEEVAAVESLQTIFGEKVVNYMVVVFTGGDDLEEDETLEEFLDQGAPTYLRVSCYNIASTRVSLMQPMPSSTSSFNLEQFAFSCWVCIYLRLEFD